MPPAPRYGDGWTGLQTFLESERIFGLHAKNPNRGPVEHQPFAALVAAKDSEDQEARKMGARIREVYYSNLQFDSNESEWTFERPLGAGTFGMVASWKRRQGDEVIDQLVTKSEQPSKGTSIHPRRGDVPAEAAHLTQLNTRKYIDDFPSMGVTSIRGYKYLYGNESTDPAGGRPFPGFVGKPLYREWRTYMEDCVYGNITRTMMCYQAWGYHVPEAFVWWTFWWLMQGCRAMDIQTGEPFQMFVEPFETAPLPGSFMLANDIKTDNCFFGDARSYCNTGAPFDNYPAARMGDFGLAQIVSISETNRPTKLHHGTQPWIAPEKRTVEMGVNAEGRPVYPFWIPQRVDGPSWVKANGIPPHTIAHCVGPEANLWTAGVIVYMLMTNDSIREVSSVINLRLRPEHPHRDNPAVDKFLKRVERFRSHFEDEAEDYSPELKELVAEVCRLEPMRRPNLDHVQAKIREGIQQERNRLQKAFGSEEAIREATRMAFTNEEWHDVPQGPFKIIPSPIPGDLTTRISQRWHDFAHAVEGWQDPSAPPIYPPGRVSDVVPDNIAQRPRPFTGPEMVVYVNPGAVDDYWKGKPLPRGGRAQPPRVADQNAMTLD